MHEAQKHNGIRVSHNQVVEMAAVRGVPYSNFSSIDLRCSSLLKFLSSVVEMADISKMKLPNIC